MHYLRAVLFLSCTLAACSDGAPRRGAAVDAAAGGDDAEAASLMPYCEESATPVEAATRVAFGATGAERLAALPASVARSRPPSSA